jgi:hypothetical protein
VVRHGGGEAWRRRGLDVGKACRGGDGDLLEEIGELEEAEMKQRGRVPSGLT